MCKILVFVLAIVLYEVQAQFCGYSGHGITPAAFVTNSPQLVTTSEIIAPPQILPTPAVPATVVDNSVANALANTLQLLIVSDVIASTLNPTLAVPSPLLPSYAPICETIPSPIIYSNYDVITPITEYISSPIVDYLSPYGSFIETVPNFFGVSELVSPVVNIGPAVNRASCGCGLQEILTPISVRNPCSCGLQEIITPIKTSCSCGLQEFVGPFPARTPCACGLQEIITPISPQTTYIQEIAGPLLGALGPNFCSGFTEVISPISNIGPFTNEIMYPASNLGYAPALPCNLESFPYTGVNYFY